MAEPPRDGTASGSDCQGLPLRSMSLDSLPQPRCISTRRLSRGLPGRGTTETDEAACGEESVHRNVLTVGAGSADQKTKNEPVVGRNNFQRARPWLGAKLTPWLWRARDEGSEDLARAGKTW